MTEYRITGKIDVTLKPDENGFFEAHRVLGTYDSIPTPSELREAGFTVEPFLPPDEIGTIREFECSGNRIILTPAGWHYLYPVNGGATPDWEGRFQPTIDQSGWIERTRVVEP